MAAYPDPMNKEREGARGTGATLERIAGALGAVLVAGGSGEITDVIIAEPGDSVVGMSGMLVLAVGVRGAEAAGLVTAAGAAGAAGVAVRIGDEVPGEVRAAARDAGVAVLGVPAGLRWDKVETEVRREIVQGGGADRRGDLYSLAQTVASLTHGLVSVEDTAHRVMAYAGPGEEADELRRRSILGRNCPEPYLALLREWGVYQRVRRGDEVVEVEARPAEGIRRRLVAGINAGTRPLGTIWLQEGDRPLAPGSERALRGAARLAGAQLVDHYYRGDSGARLRSREDLAHGLLTGRFNAAALAGHLGVAPASGASVVAVDLRDDQAWEDGTGRDARLAEAAGIVAVHAAAYRRNALVAQACGQIYAMLPEAAGAAGTGGTAGGDASESALVRWATELVTALRQYTRTPVQAVVAGTAPRLEDIPEVKLRGHQGLRILAGTPDRAVGTHSGLTSALLVREVLELLAGQGTVRHPGLASLVAHDAVHGTEMARSLRLYLDAFGDVGAVAKALNVHPNTLRYRVRKAVALSGLDLDDPEHRLAAMIQLRLAEGTEDAGRPFPLGLSG